MLHSQTLMELLKLYVYLLMINLGALLIKMLLMKWRRLFL